MKLLALAAACLALTLAACGDDEGEETRDQGSLTTEQRDSGSVDRDQTAQKVTVDMKDIKYVPKDVKVTVGTTITWTNSDDVPHTVTKTGGPGPQFDSGNVDVGGEYEQTFEQKGKIDYVCTIHPGQDGTVTVE